MASSSPPRRLRTGKQSVSSPRYTRWVSTSCRDRKVSSNASLSFFPFAPNDPSGELLSGAATFALQSYLVECGSVEVSVNANAATLLQGTVSKVVIEGKNWKSRRNLTCSELRMTVGEAVLDPAALATERLIKLKRPSNGNAQIVFSESDFGNFLTHPLMGQATQEHWRAKGNQKKNSLRFQKNASTKNGRVVFFAQWQRNDSSGKETIRVKYEMQPAATKQGMVSVTATCVSDNLNDVEITNAASAMAQFFQSLVVDLSGARLSYRNMEIDNGIISLDLRLEVVGFPPPSSLAMI